MAGLSQELRGSTSSSTLYALKELRFFVMIKTALEKSHSDWACDGGIHQYTPGWRERNISGRLWPYLAMGKGDIYLNASTSFTACSAVASRIVLGNKALDYLPVCAVDAAIETALSRLEAEEDAG